MKILLVCLGIGKKIFMCAVKPVSPPPCFLGGTFISLLDRRWKITVSIILAYCLQQKLINKYDFSASLEQDLHIHDPFFGYVNLLWISGIYLRPCCKTKSL